MYLGVELKCWRYKFPRMTKIWSICNVARVRVALSDWSLYDQFYDRNNNENALDYFLISVSASASSYLQIFSIQWYFILQTADLETKKYGPSARIPGEWKSDGNTHSDDRIQLFFHLFNHGRYGRLSTNYFLS